MILGPLSFVFIFGPAVQKGFKYGSEYLVHVDFVFAHRPRFGINNSKACAVVVRVGEQYQSVHFLRRIDVTRAFDENVLWNAAFELVVRAKSHHERTVVSSAGSRVNRVSRLGCASSCSALAAALRLGSRGSRG